MITPEQIEEWIRELEERPASGAKLIRGIGNRLRELDTWNQELLADNIALRSEHRVEEYEQRIANLEYQLELLKRQLSGLAPASTLAPTEDENPRILFYYSSGKVLTAPLPSDLPAGTLPFHLPSPIQPGEEPPGLLICSPREEILFVFDSGRSQTLAIAKITETLDWESATIVNPRAGETLVAALPIARLPLADHCVQVSRRGYAKKMMRPAFESFIARSMVGAGVKTKNDRASFLTLCAKDDLLTLVTWEGYVVSLPNLGLPYAVEQIMQVGLTDHLVSVFPPGAKSEILFITNSGKAIRRETTWLEPAGSFRARGQSVIPPARRESGARLAGAVAITHNDWLLALHANGSLSTLPVLALMDTGSFSAESEVLAVATFLVQTPKD